MERWQNAWIDHNEGQHIMRICEASHTRIRIVLKWTCMHFDYNGLVWKHRPILDNFLYNFQSIWMAITNRSLYGRSAILNESEPKPNWNEAIPTICGYHIHRIDEMTKLLSNFHFIEVWELTLSVVNLHICLVSEDWRWLFSTRFFPTSWFFFSSRCSLLLSSFFFRQVL